MNTSHFNCLILKLCQESQKPRILSCDLSQPIKNGSDTDRQTDVPLTEGSHPLGVWTLKTDHDLHLYHCYGKNASSFIVP